MTTGDPTAEDMRSADQRAAIFAAVAPLAATLALAGVAIIIDADKWKGQSHFDMHLASVL